METVEQHNAGIDRVKMGKRVLAQLRGAIAKARRQGKLPEQIVLRDAEYTALLEWAMTGHGKPDLMIGSFGLDLGGVGIERRPDAQTH